MNSFANVSATLATLAAPARDTGDEPGRRLAAASLEKHLTFIKHAPWKGCENWRCRPFQALTGLVSQPQVLR